MLVFGPYSCTKKMYDLNQSTIFFNLTSLKEGFERLNLIPPSIQNMYLNDKNFDLLYANYILQNDAVFYEMMKIVYSIYSGNTVYILTSTDLQECDFVAESLQKFIQSRYGIISNNVNSEEDLDFLSECNFSMNGLYNLDIDKERFAGLYVAKNQIT